MPWKYRCARLHNWRSHEQLFVKFEVIHVHLIILSPGQKLLALIRCIQKLLKLARSGLPLPMPNRTRALILLLILLEVLSRAGRVARPLNACIHSVLLAHSQEAAIMRQRLHLPIPAIQLLDMFLKVEIRPLLPCSIVDFWRLIKVLGAKPTYF